MIKKERHPNSIEQIKSGDLIITRVLTLRLDRIKQEIGRNPRISDVTRFLTLDDALRLCDELEQYAATLRKTIREQT